MWIDSTIKTACLGRGKMSLIKEIEVLFTGYMEKKGKKGGSELLLIFYLSDIL